MDQTKFFPAIISFEPSLTSDSVAVRPNLVARFNLDTNSTQFSDNTSLNSLVILVEENSDVTTPVTFVSYENKILTITPSLDLAPGSIYQITFLGDIVSNEGRSMGANRSFVFKVSGTSVPQVITLLNPPNNTAVAINPIFSWNAVSIASTGTLYYEIQVSAATTFNVLTWSTTTVETSALPGIALAQGQAYFWRVKAILVTSSASTVGQWSNIFCYYQGSFLQPSPSTRQTYPDPVSFNVLLPSIENFLSNLASYPDLTFIFSNPIDPNTINSSTVYLKKEAVDGYPNSNKTDVNISLTVVASSLHIDIQDPIIPNTRYILTITSGIKDIYGNSLTNGFTRQWTSSYDPLYLGTSVLRANFGQFLVDYTDDILNFQIHRVSLEVNREFLLYYNNWGGGPSEMQVRGMHFPLTWPMERWVELKTSALLLKSKLYELLNSADAMKRLGDYTEEQGASLLKDLRDIIKGLEQEATAQHAQFSRHRAVPRNVVKSQWYPEARKQEDISFNRFRRDL